MSRIAELCAAAGGWLTRGADSPARYSLRMAAIAIGLSLLVSFPGPRGFLLAPGLSASSARLGSAAAAEVIAGTPMAIGWPLLHLAEATALPVSICIQLLFASLCLYLLAHLLLRHSRDPLSAALVTIAAGGTLLLNGMFVQAAAFANALPLAALFAALLCKRPWAIALCVASACVADPRVLAVIPLMLVIGQRRVAIGLGAASGCLVGIFLASRCGWHTRGLDLPLLVANLPYLWPGLMLAAEATLLIPALAVAALLHQRRFKLAIVFLLALLPIVLMAGALPMPARHLPLLLVALPWAVRRCSQSFLQKECQQLSAAIALICLLIPNYYHLGPTRFTWFEPPLVIQIVQWLQLLP